MSSRGSTVGVGVHPQDLSPGRNPLDLSLRQNPGRPVLLLICLRTMSLVSVFSYCFLILPSRDGKLTKVRLLPPSCLEVPPMIYYPV